MPCGIKEAYKSPFSRSNPASQFYDLNSFTRSSSTDDRSIQNEIYQSQLEPHLPETNQNYTLPTYTPTQPYPPLNPYMKNTNQSDNQSNDTASLRQNQPLPPYNQPTSISNQKPLNEIITNPSQSGGYNLNPNPNRNQILVDDRNDDNDLINRVLTNKKYRKLLRQILIENEIDNDNENVNIQSKSKNVNHSSKNVNLDSQMIKIIMIYGVGGLLMLCLLDLLIKFGQIIGRTRL